MWIAFSGSFCVGMSVGLLGPTDAQLLLPCDCPDQMMTQVGYVREL